VELLPPPAERAALLSALVELAEQVGTDTLLQAPLITPEPRCFPDPWTPTPEGAWAVARRLLVYAGLGDLTLRLDVGEYAERVRGHDHHGHLREHVGEGPAAWFAGIEEGDCWFGLDASHLGTPEVLVGAFAHEVAHAYRAHHGLVVRHAGHEERLTDLTTIYLGFGVLTTNASHRYRAWSDEGLASWSQHSHLGYLSPQAMSYLLAIHAMLRDDGRAALRGVTRWLEPNQAACFEAACRGLLRPSLLARFDLSPTAPPVRPLAAVASTEIAAVPDVVDEREDEAPAANRGRPVFRHGRDLGTTGATAGLGAGGLVLIIAQAVFAATYVGVAVMVVAGVVGRVLGGRRRWDECASCAATIPADASRCPGCGGYVAGRVDHPDQRLEAEEALGDELARRRSR
jgi:hypothetical protein